MLLEIQENVPLAPLTTFKIGGTARYFAEVGSDGDLHEALEWATARSLRAVILAGGSNVLVSDSGVDGLVIRIISDRHSFAGTELAADAGCDLITLIRASSARGLGGWESLAGIPGTIGGAARGNAGAFGTEIRDVAHKVRAMNVATGKMREFTGAECAFSYRHSFFKHHPEWIITHAYLSLLRVDREESEKLIEETIAEREKRHLQNVQAAGSYFMNPKAPQHIVEMFETEKGVQSRESRVPAGWLIEKAGKKGASVGGAIASLQHPNYLVNTGSATAADVRKLATDIKLAVHEKFGITLAEEAAIL